MSDAQILVAEQDDVVQFRVIGSCTLRISRPLRDFSQKRIREGGKTFIIDFSECTGMDSTFMGVLAMLGMSAQESNSIVVLVNANKQHKDLLDGIGIAKLFSFSKQETEETSWKCLCEAADTAVNEEADPATILRAHKALVEADNSNEPKFRDVINMIEQHHQV